MKTTSLLVTVALTVMVAGCSSQSTPEKTTAGSTPKAVQPNPEYVADTEPPGAVPVGKAREDVKDGDAVTVVGHIGGSTEPFVDGLAAFTIVDPSIPYCPPEEGCPTPWDYCCETERVKDNIATVKFIDDQGNPVAKDARKLLAVEELSLVVVRGQAKRDDQGNLAILANKIFIRPKNE